MADLLIEVYGNDGADLTNYGTRKGISATTLLESIVMLHERTGDAKYLRFAEHIVDRMEANPALRLMSSLLAGGGVVHPGEGKGYQIMANLLGYLRLYRCTGKSEYLRTAVTGWNEIKTNHLLVTGGSWTRHTDYNGNRECFARTEDFDPWEVSVEGCCDTTWIQLCLHLFEVLGESKYLDAAEVTLYHSLHGHQHADDGTRWCYYTAPNEVQLTYLDRIHCCASSMPRAMEMMGSHLVGEIDGQLSIGTLAPCRVELGEAFGGGVLTVESELPADPTTKIRFAPRSGRVYSCEFRLPAGVALQKGRASMARSSTLPRTNGGSTSCIAVGVGAMSSRLRRSRNSGCTFRKERAASGGSLSKRGRSPWRRRSRRYRTTSPLRGGRPTRRWRR